MCEQVRGAQIPAGIATIAPRILRPSTATMLEVQAMTAHNLSDLDDDAIMLILKCVMDVSDLGAFSCCCLRYKNLAYSEPLWEHHVTQRWPRLPPEVVAEKQSSGCSWREFHRERCESVPKWRHLVVRMDEVEHLLRGRLEAASASPADDDQSVNFAACDELAALMLAICCTSTRMPDDHPRFRAFVCRMVSHLEDVATLGMLRRWAEGLNAALEEFYDISGANARAQLRPRLIRALKCASALRLLHHYIDVVDTAEVEHAVTIRRIWASDGPNQAFEDILVTLESLEMEGFDVAVPHAIRPVGMPRTHSWWFYHTPIHYAERC